ncbi:hypothetical protein CDD82_5678 [Ophiocordyceps australis]|uniref:Uncharacterized protein n=1 Tax=Ophiocordyceps australis TaxID=1399860 RepID=A0A2C5Z1H7_9HYPO|nr:hypothetical protein CDD82_5678 [Ophiocordyceps australis]
MTPDTASSLYPDRPIRPLPKRRLRERLSPQAAESIKYPPSTQEKAPLFYYPPFTPRQEAIAPPRTDPATSIASARKPDSSPSYQAYASLRSGILRRVGEGSEGGLRSTLVTRPAPEILTRPPRDTTRPHQPRQPEPPPSVASSVDGYESFENTNNKKKRKIPSAGDSVLNNGHSLNSDMGTLAVSNGAHPPANDTHGDVTHHNPSTYSASGPYMPSGVHCEPCRMETANGKGGH